MVNKDTALLYSDDGAYSFSQRCEKIRAQVVLERERIDLRNSLAGDQSNLVPESSGHDHPKLFQTSFKWKNFRGCPVEALHNIIPENFSGTASYVDAKSYAKLLRKSYK